jgi:hypothetical protein
VRTWKAALAEVTCKHQGKLYEISDEAEQQLNVLYESIRDAHAFGCTVQELEQATGLAPATLQNVVDGVSPPIRPTIDLP